VTSQISHHFLNPLRDCSSFSIKDISVKDVFGLSSYEGFNIDSCFVGSSTYFSIGFVFPNPREPTNSKRPNQCPKLPKLSQAHIEALVKKITFSYNSKAPKKTVFKAPQTFPSSH